MKKILIFLLATLLIASTGWSQERCDRPWPVNIPETADSREQLLEIQREVKAYLALADAYLICNEKAQAALPEDSFDSSQVLQNLLNQYNNTVDEMHQVGDQYNALVRSYKEQNPE